MNRKSQGPENFLQTTQLGLETHHRLTANFIPIKRVSIQIHSTNFHWESLPYAACDIIQGCEGTILASRNL